jgi:L-lactate dehydrogenase complex protein LldF
MTRPVDPEGLAARFIALEVHESTHDRLVWGMRQNRDKAVAGVPEWERLRELASQIKEHTLTHLDQYLEQFEQNATKLGMHVHWARDAEEHNAVVYDVLHAHRVKSLIKSKSMLQEECGMTPYLQKRGIEVTESDLGERIQQLSDEPPSHIVVPAIHKLRTDVAALFAKDIGTDPKDSDPHHLAEAMRQNARPRFLSAGAGMTGANFAVAETGGFVRSWSRVPGTLACSSGCSRAAPWARQSRSTPPTSTARGEAGSCTWSSWTTHGAIGSARPTSGTA